MSSVKKVLLKNTTRMSLNERFTFIRKNEKRTTVAERIVEQQASSKNRRLALQMDRRSQMIANKKPLSRAIHVRERLGMPRGVYTTRRRGARAGYVTTVYKSPLLRRRQLGGLVAGGGMIDSGNIGHPSRSRSPFLARRQRGRSRSRSMSRARSVSRGRSPSRGFESFGARSRSPFARNYIRGGFRPYRGRNRGGQSFGNFYFRGTSRGGFRGRFRSRGRGRGSRGRGAGRGFGGGGIYSRIGRRNAPVPTKEELDKQLDEYMTDTKGVDREGDAYMKGDSWD